MKKMTLAVDELSVETFEINGPANARGTVNGHVLTQDFTCAQGPSDCLQCYESQACTQDWHDLYCHNSENYCDPTVQVTSCAEMCADSFDLTCDC